MKVLIVNIYFHPDPTGTGLVITELACDLVAQGHDVTVITSVPHYGVSPRPSSEPHSDGRRSLWGRIAHTLQSIPKVRLWCEDRLDGIRVLRTAVYVPRRRTFWSRVLNYASFSLLALVAGLSTGPQEVLFCTSPPLSIGVTAWLLSRLKRVPLVFNVQDIYPDAAILMGMVRHPTMIGLFRRLEKFVYGRAALVTVISESARRNLLGKGVPDQKIAVIPNWVDVQHVQPVERQNEFRRSLCLDGARIVMFAGNIGLIAGLETVLEAAARLRHRPDIRFLIVGEGTAKAELVARARDMALQNVTFLTTQPREKVPEVLGAADVHLVTLKRWMSSTSVPSKTYGIMASGRPTIAAVDEGSEVWQLIEKAEAGLCVLPEEPDALAAAIETVCDDAERRLRMGEQARAHVVRHNARHELTEYYGSVLAATVRGGAAAGRRVMVERKSRPPGRYPMPEESAPRAATGGAALVPHARPLDEATAE
jgi:colanic acid biosynthesis glycosyl transferase WcaI